MALNATEQFWKLIDERGTILIAVPATATTDQVGTALAWRGALQSMGKTVEVACASPDHGHGWLPGADGLRSEIRSLKQFVITLNLQQTKLEEFSYDVGNDQLRIFITPQDGQFDGQDVSTSHSSFRYDLIITVGAPDLASLGQLFQRHTDLFYQVPLINLDTSAGNELYGQVNLVETTATSVAEFSYQIIRAKDEALLGKPVAQCLLAGIVAATHSFRSALVTPQSLVIASELIGRGADREAVVANLYRNKSLAQLKLWGRALARLKQDQARQLVWSTVSLQDFAKSGATPADLPRVIEELITTSPEARVVLLFCETAAGTEVIAHALGGLSAPFLLQGYDPKPRGLHHAALLPGKPLDLAEQEVIDKLKERIPGKG